MKLVVAALFSLTLTIATPLATLYSDGQLKLAPLSTTGEHIEDAYIVVFKKGVDINQIALHLSAVEDTHGADVST
jgi:cerevisin